MTDLPALPVTFRPTRTRAVLVTGGAGVFLVLAVIGLVLPPLGPGERVTFIATGLLLFGVLLLLSRPHVRVDEDGVTVVNLTAKRRLAWAEVLSVNLRAGDPWVQLDLADGTAMPVMGIQPGIAREQALADARALRALAERYGTASPAR